MPRSFVKQRRFFCTPARPLVASCLALALASAGSAAAAQFKPNQPKPNLAEWQGDTTAGHSAHHWHHHLLHPRCADGYPMHHNARCGTATGGPSGGID